VGAVMATYAKIQNGIVINTQIAEPTDYFDPEYQWMDVTNVKCSDGSGVQIGDKLADVLEFVSTKDKEGAE
jgi:hypothetical protein